MIHPDTELRFIRQEIGWGVFATKRIPCGTITWTLCHFDRVFTPSEVTSMSAEYREILGTYSYIDGDGNFVLCWDHARFINHACDATSLALGNNTEIAVRDIEPDEQITCEYGVLNLTSSLECRCGAPNCRGLIRGDDALRYGHVWDAAVRDALPRVSRVRQPLWPFVKDREALAAILEGRAQVPAHAGYHRPEVAPSSSARSGATGLWTLPPVGDPTPT